MWSFIIIIIVDYLLQLYSVTFNKIVKEGIIQKGYFNTVMLYG